MPNAAAVCFTVPSASTILAIARRVTGAFREV